MKNRESKPTEPEMGPEREDCPWSLYCVCFSAENVLRELSLEVAAEYQGVSCWECGALWFPKTMHAAGDPHVRCSLLTTWGASLQCPAVYQKSAWHRVLEGRLGGLVSSEFVSLVGLISVPPDLRLGVPLCLLPTISLPDPLAPFLMSL